MFGLVFFQPQKRLLIDCLSWTLWKWNYPTYWKGPWYWNCQFYGCMRWLVSLDVNLHTIIDWSASSQLICMALQSNMVDVLQCGWPGKHSDTQVSDRKKSWNTNWPGSSMWECVPKFSEVPQFIVEVILVIKPSCARHTSTHFSVIVG